MMQMRNETKHKLFLGKHFYGILSATLALTFTVFSHQFTLCMSKQIA